MVPLGLAAYSKIVKMLGKTAYIFTQPVNAKFVPDYYDIIKNPICLDEMKQRLHQGGYPTMAALYEVRRQQSWWAVACAI